MQRILLLLTLLIIFYSCGEDDELSICGDIEFNGVCGEMVESGGIKEGDMYTYTFIYELENNSGIIFGLSIKESGDNSGEIVENFILNRSENPECGEDLILFQELDITEFGSMISGSGKGSTVCSAGSFVLQFNAVI